ncbi:MAG: hypothetical protein CL960_03035 [Euryarchaeota archaeon]|jgi:hypothetical protein|nr:hypothetical protein [Euryarchaeota archaeon]|tara:strand:+ start:924 stop:1232 length:309 start_codon:yes stop_codon:yes gene_type:complete
MRVSHSAFSPVNRSVAGDLVSVDGLPPYTEVCGTLNETLLNDEWMLLFMDTCTLKISRKFIFDSRGLDSQRPPVDIGILWTGEGSEPVRWRILDSFIQSRNE